MSDFERETMTFCLFVGTLSFCLAAAMRSFTG